MAVPESVSVKDLSGVYSLNKTLSDDSGNMLYMQNVGWVVRQAVAWSNVDYHIKQYKDGEGKEHIDTLQLSTAARNVEHWIVDGESREKTSHIWGQVRGDLKFAKVSDLDDDYLKEGWEQACLDGEIILCDQESVTDVWTARQVIGFAEVDGVRRHVRRVVGKKGDQVERIRLIYDWKSPLEGAEEPPAPDTAEAETANAQTSRTLSDDAAPAI